MLIWPLYMEQAIHYGMTKCLYMEIDYGMTKSRNGNGLQILRMNLVFADS